MHDWITKISIIQLVNTVFSIYCPMFTKFMQYVDVHEAFFSENQPDLPANAKLLTTFTYMFKVWQLETEIYHIIIHV